MSRIKQFEKRQRAQLGRLLRFFREHLPSRQTRLEVEHARLEASLAKAKARVQEVSVALVGNEKSMELLREKRDAKLAEAAQVLDALSKLGNDVASEREEISRLSD